MNRNKIHTRSAAGPRLRYGSSSLYALTTGDFRCAHCRLHVAAQPEISGVVNRNHCPHCLWSRHLDWQRAGDRLSACKAPMQPIGLTMKAPQKKYARYDNGELMLIHQCTGCGKLSINRIAADDNPFRLLEAFEYSFGLEAKTLAQLEESHIQPLPATYRARLSAQLFGENEA